MVYYLVIALAEKHTRKWKARLFKQMVDNKLHYPTLDDADVLSFCMFSYCAYSGTKELVQCI